MAIAIALILLVIGTVAFHFLNPWWFTPIASNWTTMDDTVNLTFWVTGIVFVAVNLFMAYAVVRFRHRKGSGRRAEYKPEDKKLEWWLTGLTTVGVAAMLAPGLVVWAKFVTVPEDSSVIEAVGRQWAWSFRLPGPDGRLGAVDVGLISPENPLGIDPDDPAGRDDVPISGPELHVPIDKPVKVMLRSIDVLHDFTVPQFRVKMDMVPGMATYLWFTPTKTGSYEVLCEEMCGVGHFVMRGRVVVDTPADYQAWLEQQSNFAQVLARPAADVERGARRFAVCTSCHGAGGEGNEALKAPKLAGQHEWYLARQMRNFRGGLRSVAGSGDPAEQMSAIAMSLDDEAIADLAAFIATLPDAAGRATLFGDTGRGERLYTTCAYCHGARGEGVWTTNAPQLANMSDWYLLRQLEHYQQGRRGRHPQDIYGAQMAVIGKTVPDAQANRDLVAYINTLR